MLVFFPLSHLQASSGSVSVTSKVWSPRLTSTAEQSPHSFIFTDRYCNTAVKPICRTAVTLGRDSILLRLVVMSLQRRSLLSFLNSAKNALNAAIQHSTPITFVIGNESAGELQHT